MLLPKERGEREIEGGKEKMSVPMCGYKYISLCV